jgi:hypothetical protein
MPKPLQFECSFRLQTELPAGARVEMEVVIPPLLAEVAPGRLHCYGKVVRVARDPLAGQTNVICSIESYRLISCAADVELVQEKAE